MLMSRKDILMQESVRMGLLVGFCCLLCLQLSWKWHLHKAAQTWDFGFF